MWMSEFLICKIFLALGCWSHWRGFTGIISGLPTSRWWWWISFLHDMFLVVSDGWWPVSSEDGSMGANQGRRLRPVRLAMDWIVIHVLKKVTIRKKEVFSIFWFPLFCFQPACPCQCQAPWTGSGNISTATCTLSSLECKSGVLAQFVISTTYCLNICHVTNMKPKSRVTVCHACFFFFFSFVQTRLESTCTFFFGQGKSLRTVLIMPCFDWTRLESQVKWSQTRVYLHIAFFFGQGKSARHWTNSLSHSQSWGQKYRQDCQKHRNKKTQEIHWRNFTLKKLWTEFPNIIVVYVVQKKDTHIWNGHWMAIPR